MEEQLARSGPEEYPSLHPVHCPVFADQPVCGGRRMEMGPSGFLLKSLVTTHLDIRSYSSHAPPQETKTNIRYVAKQKKRYYLGIFPNMGGGGLPKSQNFCKFTKYFFVCQIHSEVLKHVLQRGGGDI